MAEPVNSQQSHVISKFARGGKRTMVIGHRGGFFGPENSMKSFQGAIANNLEGIEFDVWLSKDNVPMILHGGSDGQLDHYGLEESERVFNWTQDELQTRIDIGEGERMPTLEALIQLCRDTPQMLLNIELKGPLTAPWTQNYDYDLAAQKVVQLIAQYNIGHKTMISSFVPKILDGILRASENTCREFVIHSLRNRNGIPDELDYTTPEHMTGINIMYEYFTEEVSRKVQGQNKLLGVWYSKVTQTESNEMWGKVFTIGGGVDFFFSDSPLEAMQIRDSVQMTGPPESEPRY